MGARSLGKSWATGSLGKNALLRMIACHCGNFCATAPVGKIAFLRMVACHCGKACAMVPIGKDSAFAAVASHYGKAGALVSVGNAWAHCWRHQGNSLGNGLHSLLGLLVLTIIGTHVHVQHQYCADIASTLHCSYSQSSFGCSIIKLVFRGLLLTAQSVWLQHAPRCLLQCINIVLIWSEIELVGCSRLQELNPRSQSGSSAG